MEDSPYSEAHTDPAMQEIPDIIRNPKTDCRVYKKHATGALVKFIHCTLSHLQ
jgi:hypothetical protein